MNNTKTSFLSLCDNAYGVVTRAHAIELSRNRGEFLAPFLALKATADAQARLITSLEMQVKFLQSRINTPSKSWTKAECKHGRECTCEYGCGVK